MKIILKQDMENLGEAGDVVDVKPGYARNYLFPHGFAYEATDSNIRRLEEEKRQEEERKRRAFLEARRRASQLDDVSIVFHARAGEEGKLFGSVTPADVADRLNGLGLDFEIDRKQVELEDSIKELGVYRIPVNLETEVSVEIEVRVEREE